MRVGDPVEYAGGDELAVAVLGREDVDARVGADEEQQAAQAGRPQHHLQAGGEVSVARKRHKGRDCSRANPRTSRRGSAGEGRATVCPRGPARKGRGRCSRFARTIVPHSEWRWRGVFGLVAYCKWFNKLVLDRECLG